LILDITSKRNLALTKDNQSTNKIVATIHTSKSGLSARNIQRIGKPLTDSNINQNKTEANIDLLINLTLNTLDPNIFSNTKGTTDAPSFPRLVNERSFKSAEISLSRSSFASASNASAPLTSPYASAIALAGNPNSDKMPADQSEYP
jgi:hypothetical protein